MKTRVSAVQLTAYDIANAESALQNSLKMIDLACKDKPDLIVLPECTYPAYFFSLAKNMKETLESLKNTIAIYQKKASENGVFLAIGLPQINGKRIYNSGYLIDSQGQLVYTARQSSRHFDSKRLSLGKRYQVADTSLGKIGMIISADGLQPEISRILALEGAQLIIDLTNRVTSELNRYEPSNRQYEHMLPTRAIENKVWYISASRVEMEAKSIVFCGRSCIISPQGYEVISANSCNEEIITAEIDLAESDNKKVDANFDVVGCRRPELYKEAIRPTAELPIKKLLNTKIHPNDLLVSASVVQLKEDITAQGYYSKVQEIVPMMAIQGTKIIVFPELTEDTADYESAIEQLKDLSVKNDIVIVSGLTKTVNKIKYRLSLLADPRGEVKKYVKTHIDLKEMGYFQPGQEIPVFETPYGQIGIIMGYEGLIPEIPRILMLKGADLICWQPSFVPDYHSLFACTRAAENRVYMAVSNKWGDKSCGLSMLTNPNGQIVSCAFKEGDQVVSAQLDFSTARTKTVVSGTDIVDNRLPESYGKLACIN